MHGQPFLGIQRHKITNKIPPNCSKQSKFITETRAIFVFVFAFLFFSEAHAITFTFTNNCPYTVWPGTLTCGGALHLSTTGFELASKASSTVDVPASWLSGRIWARTGCTTDASGRFTCATADCGSGKVECGGAGATPPATVAEFTLNGSAGQDFYDISLVDGFNLPLSISPQGGSGGCKSSSCPGDVNKVCPPELAVKGSGGVVACKSACLAFNQPQYCCTGAYATPGKCQPTTYSMIFKNQCPQAYSYAYDDKPSTFTCMGGPNYLIMFCP